MICQGAGRPQRRPARDANAARRETGRRTADPPWAQRDSIAMTTSVTGRGEALPRGRATCPHADGRSPGSRLSTIGEIAIGSPSPSRRVRRARRGTIRRRRGVRPGCSCRHASGFSASTASERRPHHARLPRLSAMLSDGGTLPLYSRGVGCDSDLPHGVNPSHSLFVRPQTIPQPEPSSRECYADGIGVSIGSPARSLPGSGIKSAPPALAMRFNWRRAGSDMHQTAASLFHRPRNVGYVHEINGS